MIPQNLLACSRRTLPLDKSLIASPSKLPPKSVQFQHRWLIKDAECLCVEIPDHRTLSCIRSKKFTIPNIANGPEFCMQFFPNGIYNEKERNQVSLFMHLHTDHKIQLTCNFAILDRYGIRLIDKEIHGELSQFKSNLGLEEFIKYSHLNTRSYGYLYRGDLTIVCNVEISHILDHNGQLMCQNHLAQNPKFEIIKTETNANMEVYTQKVEMGFRESKTFSPEKLSNVVFKLKLDNQNLLLPQNDQNSNNYCKLECEDCECHLSADLQLTKCDRDELITQSCFSISKIDSSEGKNVKFYPKWMHRKLRISFTSQSRLTCDRFLHHSKLIDENLNPTAALKMNCEIEVILQQQSYAEYNGPNTQLTSVLICNKSLVNLNSAFECGNVEVS